jgi:capsular exopolysaccharide synthesis family protein
MDFPSQDRDHLRPARRVSGFPYAGEMVQAQYTAPAPVEPESESLVEEYLRTVSRHRWMIAACASAGLVLALLLGLGTRPVYRTRTSLDIRSLNGNFMDMRSVETTGGSGSPDDETTNLQTQIRLLSSDTLLDQVTRRLLAEPHPSAITKKDLLSSSLRALHLGGNGSIPYEAVVDDAVKRVKVKPLGMTRLVEVTCDSWDPQFSAHFCNVLTSTFEQQDLETRSLEAQKTQDWLTKQVADVHDRAEAARHELDAAVGGNGLMLSQGTTTSGEERLRSLQDELTKAQADRMQKEADANLAQSASPDTLPGVQDNPTHRAYEAKLADLHTQLAQLVPTLTEQNPKVIKLRAQIADAEAGLKASAQNSTSRENNELTAARHREALLDAAYRAQQASVSSDLQKAEQVSLLRKEVDSEQQLYQTLLQKAKEAGFASALQASTIRVVDPARVPHFAASPRRSLAGGAGLAMGGLFGVGLAFYRERNNKLFRGPGDTERFLSIPELGVIPAASALPARTFGLPRRALTLTAGSEAYGQAVKQTRWNDNFSLSAEAYRNTTLSILLSDQGKRSRSYVVSSPNVGEGKTTVVANLGVAMSKSRLRVALIDADLRRPNLHNAFGIKNERGLRDVLRGEIDLETTALEDLLQATPLSNVAVLPAGQGKEDVVELLHSSYFGALLARLSRDFDVILIDSPPVLHMADARILAAESDGAILIFRSRITTREQAATARDRFTHDGVRLVGTILNDFDPVAEGKPDYYASYYSYSNHDANEKVGARA